MKRLEQIIKLVSEYEKIDVNTLSEKLNVSKVTIRKDLDKLESKGLLHREHGYAVLNSGDDLNVRLSINYEIKRKIVQEAVKLVSDNETIMIESGSTCALLAEEICKQKRNVTIVTNSFFIANFVRGYDSWSCYCSWWRVSERFTGYRRTFIKRNDTDFSCASSFCWDRWLR